MKMELQNFFNVGIAALENTSGDMPKLSDLQLVYMVPRNSTQLLNINTTKFQVEREPVYGEHSRRYAHALFWFWFINQQDSLTNMFADVLA